MKVFVTGASGWVGSAVVRELIGSGHQVIGLVRSDKSAQAVAAAGAEVLRGDLDDLDSLQRGAEAADGVIHTAFIHDFSNYARSAEVDRCAIETIGAILAGSNRPLVVSSGVAVLASGRTATEDETLNPEAGPVARPSEPTALSLVSQGVRVSVVRLPPSTHGEGDNGFATWLVRVAHEKGLSAFPGDGVNRWPSVHRL